MDSFNQRSAFGKRRFRNQTKWYEKEMDYVLNVEREKEIYNAGFRNKQTPNTNPRKTSPSSHLPEEGASLGKDLNLVHALNQESGSVKLAFAVENDTIEHLCST